MYTRVVPDEALSQGDIIDGCPILEVSEDAGLHRPGLAKEWRLRVIVLTQACDLAQAKASKVLVAVVTPAVASVTGGVLKEAFIRNEVRRHRVFGWYFLPASSGEIVMGEQLVDLRNLYTVPRKVLEDLVVDERRIARLATPYREHLAQHFAVTYMRIGLPEQYETED